MIYSFEEDLLQRPRQRAVSRLADEEEGTCQEQVVGEALVRAEQTQSVLLQNRRGDQGNYDTTTTATSLVILRPSLL